MIVVDTSVWVDALRGRLPARVQLERLLDTDEVAIPAPVRIEILSGASRRDLPALRRALSALPLLMPAAETWQRAEGWALEGAADGDRFGVGDLLIAAIAADHAAPVWSADGDFARMSRRGWIETWSPA